MDSELKNAATGYLSDGSVSLVSYNTSVLLGVAGQTKGAGAIVKAQERRK